MADEGLARDEAKTWPRKLDGLAFGFLLFAVLVHPTQWAWNVFGVLRPIMGSIGTGGGTPSAVYVTASDALLGLAFLLWVCSVFLGRRFRDVRLLPFPYWAFAGATLLSVAPLRFLRPAGETIYFKEALVEIVQYAEYLFFLPLLVLNIVVDEKRIRPLVGVFVAGAVATCMIAFAQMMNVNGFTIFGQKFSGCSAWQVRGLFGNPNVLGGYLCMAAPLLFGLVGWGRGVLLRIVCALAIVLAVMSILSPGAFVILVLVLLVLVHLKDRRVFVAALVGLCVLVSWVFPRLPRQNLEQLFASAKIYRSDFRQPWRSDGAKAPWPWQQKFIEWQPAMRAFTYSPFVGLGIGSYQKNIGRFYLEIDKPNESCMEPDAISFYAILAVTMGIVGLLAFLWLMIAGGHSAAIEAMN